MSALLVDVSCALVCIRANDGTPIEEMTPELVRQVISPDASKSLRKCLKSVVAKGGTALQAAVPGHDVAGKTGTAKKFNPATKTYFDHRYTVSFAGMLPADNPEFVCVVVIDDPQTTSVTRAGGTVAGPIFAKASERIARHLHITPTHAVESAIVDQ